jgi:hypothetical protein
MVFSQDRAGLPSERRIAAHLSNMNLGTKFMVLIVMSLMWLPVPAYPILQAYALVVFRGWRRLLACLPLVFMLPIYFYTRQMLHEGDNLWPLLLIIGSPVACFFQALLISSWRRANKRSLASAPADGERANVEPAEMATVPAAEKRPVI